MDGRNNLGTLFKLSLKGGYTDLYDFNRADGQNPMSLVDAGGTLYGTTTFGGTNSDGTVFSMTKRAR